jgi:hypothetical protein
VKNRRREQKLVQEGKIKTQYLAPANAVVVGASCAVRGLLLVIHVQNAVHDRRRSLDPDVHAPVAARRGDVLEVLRVALDEAPNADDRVNSPRKSQEPRCKWELERSRDLDDMVGDKFGRCGASNECFHEWPGEGLPSPQFTRNHNTSLHTSVSNMLLSFTLQSSSDDLMPVFKESIISLFQRVEMIPTRQLDPSSLTKQQQPTSPDGG